jgi:protein SCO1/2
MNCRTVLLWSLAAVVIPFQADTAVPSDHSVYLLDSQWTTDSSRELKLRELHGHYQVLAFIFTHCSGACPLLVKTIQLKTMSMPKELRKRTRFLLVTIDPQNDTPQVLRRYRRDLSLKESEWTLLNGKETAVRELAAVVGFTYSRAENGMFLHSNLITLLDPRGEIVMQHSGSTDSDWARMIEGIEAGRSAVP